MLTLEEVKEHFKDAKEVRSLSRGTIIDLNNITTRGIHLYGGSVWFDLKDVQNGVDAVKLYDVITNKFAEIISYKDEYPKVMLVWDYNEDIAGKRVVISKFNNFYICLGGIDRLEDLDRAKVSVSYKYAKDLPIIKEVTMSEVAEAMGIEESLLRIKK